MPRFDQSCASCGWADEIVAKSWSNPRCPSCGGPTERNWHRAAGVAGDDVPGGFWAENGFDRPRLFHSKSEHRKALAAEGLEIRVKWAGPHDKHVTRWDAVSQHQLDAATKLVSRTANKHEEKVPA